MSVPTPTGARRALEAALATCELPFTPLEVPELDWALQVPAGPIQLVIGPPKGKNHLVLVAAVAIDAAHVKSLRNLPQKERQLTMERIVLALLSSDVSFSSAPERVPVPERFQIISRIFLEDLRPASLDAEVRKVRDAALKVILLVQASIKGSTPEVAVLESKLPPAPGFEDWAANLLPVSADAARRIFEIAAETGVDAAAVVDELLAAHDAAGQA